MKNEEIRHRNLLFLIDELKARGIKSNLDVANELGITGSQPASYLSQLKGGKKMGDDVADKIAEAIGQSPGWMDLPHWPGGGVARVTHSPPRVLAIGSSSSGDGAQAVSQSDATPLQTANPALRRVRVTGVATVNKDGYWFEVESSEITEIPYPTEDAGAYAIIFKGDAYFPTIKAGRGVIVEPGSPIKAGSDVLVKLTDGSFSVWELLAADAGQYRLQGINGSPRLTVDASDVEQVHQIRAVFTP